MIVSLRLQQFRSYRDESFEFAPGVNIIVGPNASGKTNLLEALLMVARGSSYRARDLELVSYGAPWARLDGVTENHARILKLQTDEAQSFQKTHEVNGKTYRRLTLAASLPVVLFEPNHLFLLSGSPELRRTFLDDILEQTVPGFGRLIRQYRRALAQRNTLLKNMQPTAGQDLFAWNVRLSELGGQIVEARLSLIATINERLSELYGLLTHSKVQAELVYETTCAAEHYATSLLHRLESSIALDRERGFTTHGPHRDDFMLLLNGHNAKMAASRGETRTLLLVLKILEAQLLEAARDHRPLLLLDDVFSELDGARRQALTSFLQPYQTFITTTDADIVIQHFMNKCHIIPVGSPSR